MPYIDKIDRKHIDRESKRRVFSTMGTHSADPGELNYMVTTMIKNYIGDEYSYSRINEVIGVLECAKLELYRRIAAPYEDFKIEENGDVY